MLAYHKPVLLKEVINSLKVKKGYWYIDATVGDGGHSLEILKIGGKVLGIDVDPIALKRVEKRLQGLGYSRQDFRLIRGNFRDLKNLIQTPIKSGQTETKFSGILFDLGVSSLQLMSPERGFSFNKVGPLDMRMDPELTITALDLIKVLTKKELYELFYKLGEERDARRVANAITFARQIGINTTEDLAKIISRTIGIRGKIHPATKVFQSLRIAVNDELHALEEGLNQSKDLIKKDGHIVVISFHSLEDRIVKDLFRKWQTEEIGKVLTKKPMTPQEDEVRKNPRSRSAKLRIFEKW